MIKALAISTVGPGLDMLLIDTDLSYTVLFSSPFSLAVVLIPPLWSVGRGMEVQTLLHEFAPQDSWKNEALRMELFPEEESWNIMYD